MDVLRQAQLERAYKKSVQQQMDEKMCRPGYRWHGEPLNRCLPAAVIDRGGDTVTDPPPIADPPGPAPEPPPAEDVTPDQAIAKEKAKRMQSRGN